MDAIQGEDGVAVVLKSMDLMGIADSWMYLS